ncbi:MAG: DNA/RNA nuclease SfsA [Candidatus Helarchaeota archaeon]
MFKISDIIDGYKFEKRINRYTGLVVKGKRTEITFIANTGRLTELLVKGAPVYIKKTTNPKRKTQFDLMAIEHHSTIVCIDTRVPNWIFEDHLKSKKLKGLEKFRIKKKEYRIGNSRIDYLLENGDKKYLVELKLCTLVEGKELLFPDAVSKRSAKHLDDLANAISKGYSTILFFIGLRGDPASFRPNAELDPNFKAAFDRAHEKGVKMEALKTEITQANSELVFSDLVEIPLKK